MTKVSSLPPAQAAGDVQPGDDHDGPVDGCTCEDCDDERDGLTFTATTEADGALSVFQLRGPDGAVRFKTVDAHGLIEASSSIYLHLAAAPAGAELEDCDLCGKCWHDTAGRRYARDLRRAWRAAGRDTAVVRAELERMYDTELRRGVTE